MYRCRDRSIFPSDSNICHRCLYIACCFRCDSIFRYSFFMSKFNYIYIALAAVACLRSLAGFGFPLFAPAMFNKLGYGIGSTILACLALVLGCPAYVHFHLFFELSFILIFFFLSFFNIFLYFKSHPVVDIWSQDTHE